jgi:hypothetical protein
MSKLLNRHRVSREERIPRVRMPLGLVIGGLITGTDIAVTAIVLFSA